MSNIAASNQFGIPSQTDVFVVNGGNGSLNVRWVTGSGPWGGPLQVGPAGIFTPDTEIAVSNEFGIPDQTDVFAVDKNGNLNVFWVSGAGAWNGPAQVGPPGLCLPGGQVAASNRFGVPNQTDVFVMDKQGNLQVLSVVNRAWGGAVKIGSLGVPFASIAASNQFGVPDQTDIFVVDANGDLNVFWVNGNGPWNGPVRLGSAGNFVQGSPIAVSNEFGIPDQTDVFIVDKNGNLNVFWVRGGGSWNGPAQLGPAGLCAPGGPVAASNQFGIPNQTDVFVVDLNGNLQVLWVINGTWGGPTQINPSGVRFTTPFTPIAAAQQFGVPNQTDLFVLGQNGVVNVFWVVGAGSWNGPLPLK